MRRRAGRACSSAASSAKPCSAARQPLWHDLVRGATLCVVLADFAEVRADDGVVEVPIDDASPLQREWAVAVAGPGLRACLTGWELLAGGTRFEAIWTVEPDVVDAALQRVLAVARHRAPDQLPDIALPAVRQDTLPQVLRLMDRIVARLDPRQRTSTAHHPTPGADSVAEATQRFFTLDRVVDDRSRILRRPVPRSCGAWTSAVGTSASWGAHWRT